MMLQYLYNDADGQQLTAFSAYKKAKACLPPFHVQSKAIYIFLVTCPLIVQDKGITAFFIQVFA